MKANPETSVIIRTKNEQRWIAATLQKLSAQSYQDFEMIVIDSGSTDSTLFIAGQFPVRLFEIPPQDFSYPHALNYAIERAVRSSRYLCIMSAHSLPISNTWLADGLENFSLFQDIAGAYGPVKPLPDATFWDKLFQEEERFLPSFLRKPRRTLKKKAHGGVLGFTNAIIRKDLWEKRPFNEAYGAGGEDQEWAEYWLAQGYRAVRDKKFAVMHSHYLGLFGWWRQYRHWKSVGKPQPFRPLPFRNDRTHNP